MSNEKKVTTTFRINKELLEWTQEYAKKKFRSVASLIQEYFAELRRKENEE